MRAIENQLYTLEEYLELDHQSEEKIEFWDGHVFTLLVKVSSDSIVDFDYSYKFTCDKSIPSFTEYLLIAQDRPHVSQFIKQADNAWLNHEFDDLSDAFRLPTLDCKLKLSEIYQDVVFPEISFQNHYLAE